MLSKIYICITKYIHSKRKKYEKKESFNLFKRRNKSI